MLNWIFGNKHREAAEKLYKELVEVSRNPSFYADHGVPDTLDGRFEMISLHVFFEMQRLIQTNPKMAQALFDVMFRDMDRSARERGVGDLSVPKHMKRMMKALHGRAQTYKDALAEQDNTKLEDAVRRNIFGTVENPDPAHVAYFVIYMRAQTNTHKQAA